jgi:anthranilate phosphoribosyltransferase
VIEAVLGKLAAGQNLTQAETADAIDAVMRGECSEGEIGLLLTSLAAKGETVDEVAGAALAMRRHMTPIHTRRTGLLDTCGTGGDGSGTFNISTAAAIVTAAAGVPVAKHGNRSITSRTGSADVLAALGVNVECDVAKVEACLDGLGLCFCFAPLLHQSMKHAAPVRKKLGIPTIFNLLGPLSNPANAGLQVLGVSKAPLRPLLAAALQKLGTRHAIVVRGDDGLDELTIATTSQVSEITTAGIEDLTWHPDDFGLPVNSLETLVVDGPPQSADVIRSILSGERGPARDIVVLNSAAALWVAGKSQSQKECARIAAEAIDSGTARELLARLVELTNA